MICFILGCTHFGQDEVTYCLAIVKSSNMNIIGRKSSRFTLDRISFMYIGLICVIKWQ